MWLVNAWMVRIGLAWVYYGFVEGTAFAKELVAAEDAAWSEGAGSWKVCSW
jgi:endonuclease YncB( thermonuclease family)